jgi:hypothetical protein
VKKRLNKKKREKKEKGEKKASERVGRDRKVWKKMEERVSGSDHL